MTQVIVSKEIKVEAVVVWDKLSSFRGIENFSPIEKSETVGVGAGATRTCYLPDGAAIHEVLDQVDDKNMEMVYKITEGPFPITDYTSTIKISKVSDGISKISWGAEFQVDEKSETEMIALFEGLYNVIIDSLEERILELS